MGGSGAALLLRFDSSQPGSSFSTTERHLDLAPHDLSIIDYLIGLSRSWSWPPAGAHLNAWRTWPISPCAFPNNIIAHLNVNWLSP